MKRFQWVASVVELVLIGGLMMFLSMAAGEMFIRQDLFGGFLGEPESWIWLFLETAAWLFPCAIVGLLVLSRSKKRTIGALILRSAVVWLLLGAVTVVVYKAAFFPENWDLKAHAMEMVFGWALPFVLIWLFFTGLSIKYLRHASGR